MKRILSAVLVSSLLGPVALAESLERLQELVQKNRAMISHNASIDSENPESVDFKTDLNNQLVELNLKSSRLNDTFVSAINYPSLRIASKSMLTPPTNVLLGDLQIWLDGCDVTTALITQCNTNQCWDSNPTTPRTVLSGLFGTEIYLNLSALNPQMISGCTPAVGQTSFFDSTHTTHRLEFRENGGVGKGGSLNYQVIIYHKAYQ